MTVAALTVAAWLALQIPIGMVVGCYIRRAQALAQEQSCFGKLETRRSKRRPFGEYRPPAVLLGR